MAIKIIYYSEVIDNWGRMEASMRGDIIFAALSNVEEWTDDMMFEDDKGQKYFIDELVGKEVSVPDIGIFTVPNE